MASTHRALLALLGLTLFTATAVQGGALEPAKPSEVIHLRTSGTVCPNAGAGTAIDVRTFPDGQNEFSYRVPPKRVLVIRRVDFQASPGVGTNATVSLSLGGSLVAIKVGTGASFASFDGSFEFNPGLIVADNSRLCIGTQNGSAIFSTAVGFLAKDK